MPWTAGCEEEPAPFGAAPCTERAAAWLLSVGVSVFAPAFCGAGWAAAWLSSA